MTGSGAVAADLGWLRMSVRAGRRPGRARRRERGARGRRPLGPTLARGSPGRDRRRRLERALPFRSARDLAIGPAPALAQRITYVGELGYELYVPPEWAAQAWDRLLEAGRAYGITPAGYRVLDSLRMEKGYRYYGTDLTALDTPDEAGLGFCVSLERKGDFLGRTAIEAERSRPAGQAAPDAPRRRARLSDAVRGRGRGGGRSGGRADTELRVQLHGGANCRLRLPRRGDPDGRPARGRRLRTRRARRGGR